MKNQTAFQPDLIIEVTNACNRTCNGCYAPNVFTKSTNVGTVGGVSQLDSYMLEGAWPRVDLVDVVGIRGGEPTLNPNLPDILRFASIRSEKVFLETNGDWITSDSPLLSVLREYGCIVKLSIDSMHGSEIAFVEATRAILDAAEVQLAIAITEPTQSEFEKMLDLIPNDFSGPVFWQRKVSRMNELIQPTYGVISAKGEFKKNVTHKFSRTLSQSVTASLFAFIVGMSIFSQPALAEQKIAIGIAANFSAMSDSTSNPYANYFRNAIEMAFDEKRELLKSKGLEVQIKEFDYSDDKLKVIETANSAVQSNVLAVIGYIYSSDALLAGPIFTKNKLLMLTPTATADRVEEVGHFVRRTCFNDSYQGKILGDYAWKKEKIRTVAIVSVADCAYCQSLRTAFKDRFEALGGKITADQTVLSSDTNYDDLVLALKSKKVDAIFVPNYERISATIISALYDAGIKPRLWLGGDGWGNSVDLFYRIIGKRKFKAYTISHWHRDIQTQKSKTFLDEFTKRYGKSPVDTAVLAYDAAAVIIQGLISAKSFTREGILESVEKIKSFDGVTGKMVYPSSGRTPAKPAVLLRLEDGKLNVERIIGG